MTAKSREKADGSSIFRPTRRDFLAATALGAIGIACTRKSSAPDAAVSTKTLSFATKRTLHAFVARLAPLAREARVADFIEGQLGTPELAHLLPIVTMAMMLLDRWAGVEHQAPFALLAAKDQDSVLSAFAQAKIPARNFPQSEVFRALHTLTLEGLLSDPIHGGNSNQIGWRFVGFIEPSLRTPGAGHHHD